MVLIVTKSLMEREELYDAPNNSGPLEQELPLEDFGDYELKSKPYVRMQFDSLDNVETFYKEFAKQEGFGFRIRTSKKASRSDNVTNHIYVCCSEGQHKTKNTFNSGESRDDENKAHKMDKFNLLSLAKFDTTFNN